MPGALDHARIRLLITGFLGVFGIVCLTLAAARIVSLAVWYFQSRLGPPTPIFSPSQAVFAQVAIPVVYAALGLAGIIFADPIAAKVVPVHRVPICPA